MRVDHLTGVLIVSLHFCHIVILFAHSRRDKSMSNRGGGARRFREIWLSRIPSRSSRSRRYRNVRIWIIEGSIRGSIRGPPPQYLLVGGAPERCTARKTRGIGDREFWRWSVQTDEVTEIKSIGWRQKLTLFSGDCGRPCGRKYRAAWYISKRHAQESSPVYLVNRTQNQFRIAAELFLTLLIVTQNSASTVIQAQKSAFYSDKFRIVWIEWVVLCLQIYFICFNVQCIEKTNEREIL